MDGNFVRVLAWYDNEWGFSNRMADTAVAMGKLIWSSTAPWTAPASIEARQSDNDGRSGRAMTEKLEDIARALVAPGKGILAADESSGTIKKRFDRIKLTSTEDSRRDYREMLFRATDAMKNYVSGVILYDETIRQKAKDGTTLVDVMKAAGSIPRHQGRHWAPSRSPASTSKIETITEGLDGLRERLAEYYKLGARFAKWRGVITIADGLPELELRQGQRARAGPLRRHSPGSRHRADRRARSADGRRALGHDIDECYRVTEWTLRTVFRELYDARVDLEGIVLKPNMVIAGQKSREAVQLRRGSCRKTSSCLKATVPVVRAGHRLPLRRPVRRSRDPASVAR